MQYADISELDDKAHYIRVTWSKMINYAATFTNEFLTIENEFKTGKYGPEWTFARWLGAKCGISERSTYRMIKEIHRTATDDQREHIKNTIEEQNRIKAWKKADSRASQLAWDQYCKEEKQRIKDEKDAAKEAKAKEKKDETRRVRNRKYYRLKKAKKANEDKGLENKTPPDKKPLPNLAVEEAIAQAFDPLVALLSKLPKEDLIVQVNRIVAQLILLTNEPVKNGHDTDLVHPAP